MTGPNLGGPSDWLHLVPPVDRRCDFHVPWRGGSSRLLLALLTVVRTARSASCRLRENRFLRSDAAPLGCWSDSFVCGMRTGIPLKSNSSSFGGTPMNEQETSNTPSERQRKYLGLLLAKAHEHGVPYLPTEQLTRAQV